MSERVGTLDQNIDINDLPLGETLTPEERELFAGAGRFRPTIESLEMREMMDAGIGGALMASLPEIGHMPTMATAPLPTAEMPADLWHASAPGTNLIGDEGTTLDAAGTTLFNADFGQDVVGTRPDANTWFSDDKRGNNRDHNNQNVIYDNKYVDHTSYENTQYHRTLEVVADPDATDGKALALTIFPKDSNGEMRSARINTSIDPVAGHLQFGRIEARIKLPGGPGGKGVWPAFWMLGSDLAAQQEQWPKCGEIDIMEYWGNQGGTMTGTLVATEAGSATTPKFVQNSYTLKEGTFFDSGYHTFAVDWSPNSISFSVDGNVYKTLERSDFQASQWNFDKPFYVVLNISDNTNQPNGSKEATKTPQTMLVDYVRAYSLDTATAAAGTNHVLMTGGFAAAAANVAPATTVEAPAANESSDQQDIRQKLEQIKQVVAVLKEMDVPDVPPAQWLDGQSQKNQLLTEADKTELERKQSEIRKLQSRPEKATILADEEAELAIMKDKMAKMTELQMAIEQAQRGQPGADLRVVELIRAISHDELNLKNQQVATLQDQLEISHPDKQPALQKLLEGEQYEVEELKQIYALNREIEHQVHSGGDAAELADLRRQVVQHELLMKEQNERQLEARLKPDSGPEKGDGVTSHVGPGPTQAVGSEVQQVLAAALPQAPATTDSDSAGPVSNATAMGVVSATTASTALSAASPAHYHYLDGVKLPAGPHLTTQGIINIAFDDGIEHIRYKETNPKMFGPTTADNGLWEKRLPVMAAQFLNGASSTDMIFLDAEVDPGRLAQLMQYSLPDASDLTTRHSLKDYFSVVNVDGSFTGDRGAVLYRKGKYEVVYDPTNYGDNRNQTHAVAIDAHKSRAGSQAIEYISRFQVTSIASQHRFDIYLGKGPHNDANGADFLTKAFQKADPGYPGLIPKNNESMLDWIGSQSGHTPAIMIGDWNNELSTVAVDHALQGYAHAQLFHNHYNDNHILDNPQHPGSNVEDLLVGKDGAYSTGKDITKVSVSGETWDSLKHNGKVNTQVLSFSTIPITVDNPTILRDIGPYGDQNIPVDPSA